MGRLDNKVAIVTGAARGLGRQIALTFAKEGADIVIADVLTEGMEASARDIIALGRQAIAAKTDVTNKDSVKDLVDSTVARFGKIDILVNNAGVTRNATLLEMTEADWDTVLGVNLKGVFLCTQAVARHMVERKYGKIVNIASIAGIGSTTEKLTHYAASKAGVIQFTRACARELGRYNINVNAINPGTLQTDLLYRNRTTEQVEQMLEGRRKIAALGRIGTTQDIASLALFLASDESSFVTAEVITADGGRFDRT